MDRITRDFYEKHRATPGGVVIAHIYDGEGEETATGVFSDLTKAHAWADRYSGEASSAIFSPYIIDEPDFGNVSPEEIN